MKQEDIEIFYKAWDQLNVTITEISELSKKKPNDAANNFKLKYINKILEDVNRLLGDTLKPFPDFTVFDEDDLPTNSDISLILAQYESSLYDFFLKNTATLGGIQRYWLINGEHTQQEAHIRRSKK